MKKINQKGFTLIELLAVIVILGILMLIAIPSVTKYIDKSKKEAYINNAQSYIEAVRKDIISGHIQAPNANQTLIIKLSSIELEKGSAKSPYDNYETEKSYIMVKNRNNQLEYYIAARDKKGNEIPLTNEKSLTTNSVSKNEVSKISPTTDYGVKDEETKDEETKAITNLFNGNLYNGCFECSDADTGKFPNAQYTDEFEVIAGHTYKIVGVKSSAIDINGLARWRAYNKTNGEFQGELWGLQRKFSANRKVRLILTDKNEIEDLELFGIYDITDTINE